MTQVSQAATAELVSAAAPATGWLARSLGLAAVALALLSALVTFVVLAGLTPIAPTHEVVVSLLAANGITILILLAVIVREVWRVVQARRRGRAGARLHVRIVALFSVIAAVPAVAVAVVASVTLDRGLDRLFSQQTHSMIENSLIVAEAYVREHVQFARAECIAVAIELARAKPLFDQSREQFHQFLTVQASIRGLPAVMLLDSELKVVDQVEASPAAASSPLRPRCSPASTTPSRRWRCSSTPITSPPSSSCAATTTSISTSPACSTRACWRNCARPRPGVAQYADLSARRIGIQIAFALMYTVIALIVLCSAVWIALNFANYLVAPIRRLIGAAQVVSTGNLYVQVPTRRSEGDLAQLGETFNRMTQELRTQRDDIVRARDLIDSRRRFTEAVLASASAGVIGIDAESSITILNRSAEQLIGRSEAEALGRPLAEIVPELSDMIAAARVGRAAPGAGPGDDQPQRPRALPFGAGHRRAGGRRRAQLRGDARRHHRAGQRAAHLGLGRRRAPHRPRDQEPAHADPALGRATAAQIRLRDQGRRRHVQAMHRYHRAPGGRHQAHGGRVLALRPHAEAGDGIRGRGRHRPPGGVPAARRQCRHRHRRRDRGRAHAREVRPPADLAGAHQHHQERDRGDRRGAAGRARPRPYPGAGRAARARTSSST